MIFFDNVLVLRIMNTVAIIERIEPKELIERDWSIIITVVLMNRVTIISR